MAVFFIALGSLSCFKKEGKLYTSLSFYLWGRRDIDWVRACLSSSQRTDFSPSPATHHSEAPQRLSAIMSLWMGLIIISITQKPED